MHSFALLLTFKSHNNLPNLKNAKIQKSNYKTKFLNFQPQDPLVEYDPDVDVDGLEETQPYLIEYLEEEIPIPNSPGPDLLRTPPKEIKKEVEKPIKQEAPATRVKPQTFNIQQRPIVKTIANHQSLVKKDSIGSHQSLIKNQSNVNQTQIARNHTPVVRNQPTVKNPPILKSQSAVKTVPILKNNSFQVIKKHTPVITREAPREVPKPMIKKEGQRSAKKPTEPPLPEIRRNPPREISKRRYTTSEINDFIDSESLLDEDEEDDQIRIKKRRLTFTQQQKSLADSLGMEEEEEEDEDGEDVQVPTSTSTQKSNMARGHTNDEDAINTQFLPQQPRTMQLAEAQSEYFRDKNIREEKKEQREAEEHKLKMKKLWLDIRKTLLEINALETDNIDCEQ